MRTIKFRFWNKTLKQFSYPRPEFINLDEDMNLELEDNFDIMQFTGLKDRNGKEIYEFMELDNKWEVDWLNGKYILRNISNGDIIDLAYENKYEITREYTKV